jgi:hypothetical protein
MWTSNRGRIRARPALLVNVSVVALWLACGGGRIPQNPNAPTLSDPIPGQPVVQQTVVLAGAGDIANCDTLAAGERVAQILDGIDGLVFTTGDNVYENGTLDEFQRCYTPTWGRHLTRTRPSPGNHDYNTKGAAGYFQYFGEVAGPAGIGYYSYDHGAWKILSLNSMAPAGPGSPQFNWVAEELRSSKAKCTLAYWHHPVFSSGHDGNMPNMRAIWQLLYDHYAEVVVVGHSHNYERFAPQDLDARPRPGRGIREFVVGTGGTYFTNLFSRKANSEIFNNNSQGVLKLTLAPADYTWEFVPAAGATFRDSGSDVCF